MDGLWNAVGRNELLRQQDLIRHRLLRFNTSAAGALNEGDASSHGRDNPNTTLAVPPEGGPHFVMSPQTGDGRPTLGFEFCLCDPAQLGIPGGERATFAAGGVTITLWCLIGSTFGANGSAAVPIWASFAALASVQYNELYRSFDVNTTCVRFQVGPTGLTADGSVVLAFAEL